MTEQLIPEQTPHYSPELAPETPPDSPHRLRTFLTRNAARAAIVACGVLGAGAAMVSQQPDAERVIGPVSVDTQVVFSPDVEVIGLPVADTEYGIGMDVSVKVRLDNIPEISRRLAPLAEQIASKDNHKTIVELVGDEYAPEINSMKHELIRESLLYMCFGAIAGSFAAAKIIEKLGSERQGWRFLLASGMAGVLLVSGAEYQSLGTIDTNKSAERLSQELRQPFDKYLLTSTSDMLVNLDSIDTETRMQITRLVRIIGALNQKQPEEAIDSQTWVIYSDSHELPTVPGTVETLAQSTNANAVMGLGDYGNTGNEFEMGLLGGFAFDKTHFTGFDDIRTCASWNVPENVCDQRGDILPHGALSGNHDPANILDIFKDLGMTNLDQMGSFNGIPIFALSDACFVDSPGCRGDDARTVNQQYAENQLIRMEANGRPLPKIGFFASYDAAEVFFGKIDTLIVGGKHEFSHVERKGSEVYYVGTVGQAFPRGAKEAGALILSLGADGTLLQCGDVSWQTLGLSNPKIGSC